MKCSVFFRCFVVRKEHKEDCNNETGSAQVIRGMLHSFKENRYCIYIHTTHERTSYTHIYLITIIIET